LYLFNSSYLIDTPVSFPFPLPSLNTTSAFMTSPMTPPSFPLLAHAFDFSEPNSPPDQVCSCGQVVLASDESSSFCSSECAHRHTLSSLLGTATPSRSSKSLPQTPTRQLILLDTSNPPPAPARVRSKVASTARNSRVLTHCWADENESPLMESSLPIFGTPIYQYDSDADDDQEETRYGGSQPRIQQGRLGEALFGNQRSASGSRAPSTSSASETIGEVSPNVAVAKQESVRGMTGSSILSMNRSLLLGLSGASEEKVEPREGEPSVLEGEAGLTRNLGGEKGTSCTVDVESSSSRHLSLTSGHQSSPRSSCPTPLVSQLAYRNSVATQASTNTVNCPSKASSQQFWSYSPQFSDTSSSSKGSRDSIWENSGLESVGTSQGSDSSSLDSLYSRSRATTVSSCSDAESNPWEEVDRKPGSSKELQDLDRRIQETFDAFSEEISQMTVLSTPFEGSSRFLLSPPPNLYSEFECEADEDEESCAVYSSPLGFEELHQSASNTSLTDVASPRISLSSNRYPKRNISTLKSLEMKEGRKIAVEKSSTPNLKSTFEPFRPPMGHQKSSSSSSAPISSTGIRSNYALSVSASISSPTLIRSSLCQATLQSCRDIKSSSHSQESSQSSNESRETFRPSSRSGFTREEGSSKPHQIKKILNSTIRRFFKSSLSA